MTRFTTVRSPQFSKLRSAKSSILYSPHPHLTSHRTERHFFHQPNYFVTPSLPNPNPNTLKHTPSPTPMWAFFFLLSLSSAFVPSFNPPSYSCCSSSKLFLSNSDQSDKFVPITDIKPPSSPSSSVSPYPKLLLVFDPPSAQTLTTIYSSLPSSITFAGDIYVVGVTTPTSPNLRVSEVLTRVRSKVTS